MSLSRFIRQQWRIYQQRQRRKAYRDYLKSDDWPRSSCNLLTTAAKCA